MNISSERFILFFSVSSVGSDWRIRVHGLVRPVWDRLLVEVKFQMAFNFELKSLVRLGAPLFLPSVYSVSALISSLSRLSVSGSVFRRAPAI